MKIHYYLLEQNTSLDDEYISHCGNTIKREYGVEFKGEEIKGHWVLRDINNNIIDYDNFRHDLVERNNGLIVYYV